MKKTIYALFALLFITSCQEWDPVVSLKYDEPAKTAPVTMKRTHTIKDLCAMYSTGKPFTVSENVIIAGQVTTTDQPGNFYKSFYIQDETSGIEIKIGKNSLYNTYREGQWIYVMCQDLRVGCYGYKSGNYGGQGMVQIGFVDSSGQYETSYLESPLLIDSHILRGEVADPVKPVVISESDLPKSSSTQVDNPYIGRLVTLKGLKYAGEVFALLYLNSSADKTSYTNRVFLSDSNPSAGCDKTHGVTTWAMSKAKMTEYLKSGVWDDLKIGSGSSFTGETLGDLKGDGSYPKVEKAAYSVSQYFKMGSTEIQIRTSGFSKFADYEIDPDVLSGKATVDVTGILTLYQGSIQFVVNSLDDIVVNK